MQNDQPNPLQNKNPSTPKTAAKGGRGGAIGRLLARPAFWVVFLTFAMALPLIRSVMQPTVELPPVIYQLPDFQLKNQEGVDVSLKSFEGSTLVVNFIFTSCPGVCPLFTKQMAKIQNRIVGLSPAIRLVSISVDPETDTPAVLKNYGNENKASFASWSFLTGPLDEIKRVVTEGFKLVLQRSDQDFMDITHGEHFVIVDQIGQIRAFTHARNDSEIDNVIKLLALVANSNPKLMTPAAR